MKVKLICCVCENIAEGELCWKDKERRVPTLRTEGFFLDGEGLAGAIKGWFCSIACIQAHSNLTRKESVICYEDEPVVISPLTKEQLH